MNTLQLLASSNFIVLNKKVIKVLGLEEALLLGELSSEYDYWLKCDKLEDGWFYSTVENIENNTTLNEYKQRKAVNKLIKMGVVEVEVKGLPAKRYFRLNEERVVELLDFQLTNDKTSSSNFKEPGSLNFKEPVPEILQTNNNKANNNKESNNINIITSAKNEFLRQVQEDEPSKSLANNMKQCSLLEVKKVSTAKKKDNRIKELFLLADSFSHNKSMACKNALREFIQNSIQLKRTLTTTSFKKQLELLSSFSENEIIEILDATIRSGWINVEYVVSKKRASFDNSKSLNLSASKRKELSDEVF